MFKDTRKEVTTGIAALKAVENQIVLATESCKTINDLYLLSKATKNLEDAKYVNRES